MQYVHVHELYLCNTIYKTGQAQVELVYRARASCKFDEISVMVVKRMLTHT